MKSIIRGLLSAAAIIAVSASARGGVDRFTNVSPSGATLSAIVIDRLNPATMYGAAPAGIFRSRDAGETWDVSLDLTALNLKPAEAVVTALTIANDSSAVYAGMRSGALLKSEDGGETWSVVTAFQSPSPVVEVAADPSSPRTVYVLTYFDLLQTSDGGLSWTSRTQGLPVADRQPNLLSFTIDPSRTSVLYVGTSRGLYVSNDRGLQWKLLRAGVYFTRVTVDPNDPAVIYVLSTPKLHSTRDEGKTWTDISAGQVSQIVVDPVTSTAYAVVGPSSITGAAGGILASTDRGLSWKPVLPMLSRPTFLAIGAPTANTFFAASRGYLFKSGDGGTTWRRISAGLSSASVADVVADPTDPSILYAATEQGVVKSTDGGKRWSEEKIDIRRPQLAIDPRQPSTVFAAGNDAAARSADGGETWTTIRPGQAVQGFAVDPTNSANVYAVLTNGLARSADGGFTWAAIGVGQLPLGYYGFDGGAIAIDPQTPTNMYVAGGGGITKSVDAGTTWRTVFADPNSDFYFRDVLIDPRKPSTLYALSFRHLYRSENGGQDWRLVYSSSVPAIWFTDIEFDPLQPSRLYLATSSGVMTSLYRGNEWTDFNEGLPPTPVNSIMVDSIGNVYAATPRGLFVNSPRHELAPGASTLSVSLRTVAGNYVSANDCGGTFVHANADDAGPCETFVMRDLNAGMLNDGDAVLLRAEDGAFLVAEGGGSTEAAVNANRGRPAEWETFIIRRAGGTGRISSGDSITLQSSSGFYVAADGGGGNGCDCDSRLTADRAEANAWETFVLVIRSFEETP